MAYTTVDKVTSEFSGIDFGDDTQKISELIEEAERKVSQYDLCITGNVDAEETDKLIDYHINFEARGITNGSHIWETDNSYNRLIEDGVLQESTVTNVEKHTLTFDVTYGNVSFEKGDPYLLEDTARREIAERYKTASLLYGVLVSNKNVVEGSGTIEVGDISIEQADFETLSNQIPDNWFEKRYRQVVGYL